MISHNLKVEIRPIANRNNIREFSKELEYHSQNHIIAPYVNPVTHRYETGLTDEDIAYLKELKCPYDLSDVYTPGKAHEFWESSIAKIELGNSPQFLYPYKSILDFIKWKYLLVSNYVYKSEAEMATGSKPQATHYIYDESEEVSIKAVGLQRRNALIGKLAEMPLADKRKLILILEEENCEEKSDAYVAVKLDNIINSSRMKELEELVNSSKEDIHLKALVKLALQKGFLRKTKQGHFYYEHNLGYREYEVVEFLEKDENQEILLSLTSKVNS